MGKRAEAQKLTVYRIEALAAAVDEIPYGKVFRVGLVIDNLKESKAHKSKIRQQISVWVQNKKLLDSNLPLATILEYTGRKGWYKKIAHARVSPQTRIPHITELAENKEIAIGTSAGEKHQPIPLKEKRKYTRYYFLGIPIAMKVESITQKHE